MAGARLSARCIVGATLLLGVVVVATAVPSAPARADGPLPGPPPAIDRTFGDADVTPGEVDLQLPGAARAVAAVTARADDSIVAVTTTTEPASNGTWVRHVLAGGAIDATFAGRGLLALPFTLGGAAFATDGGFVLAHERAFGTPTLFERFSAAGLPDTAFTDGSKPNAIALASDARLAGIDGAGRVYVATGSFGITVRLRRYGPSGVGDTAYGSGGEVDTGIPTYGVLPPLALVHADGVVALLSGATSASMLYLVQSDGTIAPSAVGGIALPAGAVTAATLDPAGRVLAAIRGPDNVSRIVRLAIDGIAVPFSGTGGVSAPVPPTPYPFVVRLLTATPDGGAFAVAADLVTRLGPDGLPDPTFNADRPSGPDIVGTGLLRYNDQSPVEANAAATDAHGRLVIGGTTRLSRLVAHTAPPDIVATSPERLLDTRVGGPQVGYVGDEPRPGSIVALSVVGAGLGAVPSDALAVAGNLTATEATSDGFVTAWPCDATRPVVSNVNLVAGGTAANLVVVKLAGDGSICLFTQSGAHLVFDLTGYVPFGSAIRPVVPTRVLDSRAGPAPGWGGPFGSKPLGGVEYTFDPKAQRPVPPSTRGMLFNVTGTEATADGYVTVWPCAGGRNPTSTLNLRRGETRPNMTVLAVQPQSGVCFTSQSGTHLLADLAAYVLDGSRLRLPSPTRLLDTRDPSSLLRGRRPLAGETVTLPVAGATGSPVPTGASTALLNVTGTDAAADGYVTVWPCGVARPLASSLNLTIGATTPNLVLVKVGTDGQVCLYTQSGAHLIADVVASD